MLDLQVSPHISEGTREGEGRGDTIFPGNLNLLIYTLEPNILWQMQQQPFTVQSQSFAFQSLSILGAHWDCWQSLPSLLCLYSQQLWFCPKRPSMHEACQPASWAKWQIHQSGQRGRWCGVSQYALKARLLPFVEGMGAQDLCCCTWKINIWSPHAFLVSVCYPADSNAHPSTLPWLITTTLKYTGEWALPHVDERRFHLPWDVEIPLRASS